MRPELKAQISIPFVLTCIFAVSSFVPVIQILILTLNGGYLATIKELISPNRSDNSVFINLTGNLLPIIILLFWFYKETNKIPKIIAASLAMSFMTALFLFMTMDDNSEHDPYWLQFLIVAFVSGLVLTLVAYLRYWRTIRNKISL